MAAATEAPSAGSLQPEVPSALRNAVTQASPPSGEGEEESPSLLGPLGSRVAASLSQKTSFQAAADTGGQESGAGPGVFDDLLTFGMVEGGSRSYTPSAHSSGIGTGEGRQQERRAVSLEKHNVKSAEKRSSNRFFPQFQGRKTLKPDKDEAASSTSRYTASDGSGGGGREADELSCSSGSSLGSGQSTPPLPSRTASSNPKQNESGAPATSPIRGSVGCPRLPFKPQIRGDNGELTNLKASFENQRGSSTCRDGMNNGHSGAEGSSHAMSRADRALQVAQEYGLDGQAAGWSEDDYIKSTAARPIRPAWELRTGRDDSFVDRARRVTGYGFYFGATESPYDGEPGDSEGRRHGGSADGRQSPLRFGGREDRARAGGGTNRGSGEDQGLWGRSTFRSNRSSFSGVISRVSLRCSELRKRGSAASLKRTQDSGSPGSVSDASSNGSRDFQCSESGPLCGCFRYATARWKARTLSRSRFSRSRVTEKKMRRRRLKELRCENAAPFLGPQSEEHKGKTTLVLDLDETLVHSSFRPVAVAAFMISVELDNAHHEIHVCKRPGVDNFLEIVSRFYEVVIFTASLQSYADPLIDRLDPRGLCAHRLFRNSCSHWKGLWIKDLDNLGRDLRRVILIDNSPSAYLLHPWNAIPIKSWFFNMADTELYDLIPILSALATVEDIPAMLRDTVGPSCRERVREELRLLGELEGDDDDRWFS